MSLYRIGRVKTCDLVISDRSVSRLHAELEVLGGGQFRIRDQQSTYGTYVERDAVWEQISDATVTADTPVAFGSYRTTPGELFDMGEVSRLMRRPTDQQDASEKPRDSGVVRRLAAILAADVVGYSRLMEKNEAGTLKALKNCRRTVFDPMVARSGGRIFKVIGDGILVEFKSVVDGVRCALNIQTAMRNRVFEPLDAGALQFRIGLNMGDVICDGDDIYGNGVNIAARLEGLADPGGLSISGPVYDQIAYAMDLQFTELGERKVKNIEQTVRVFNVHSTASGRTFPIASRDSETDEPSG